MIGLKRLTTPVAAVAIALTALATLWVVDGAKATAPSSRAIPRLSESAFHDDMRKLWEDHVTWTRMFIVSAASDLPDVDLTAKRLLQNQADIGDAIAPFYGEQAGNRLAALLRDHILIAADVLSAAKAGSQSALGDALDRWYANGDDVAAFLHAANPDHWPLEHMRAMMREHLDLTLEEASQRLQGNFAADIAAYDDVHVAILGMADMLSSGIVRQFPGGFTR
jgi:hypothetical protein